MTVDRFLRVDGFVSHGCVDVLVPQQNLSDMRRHAVHDGVGSEDSAQIMGLEVQRFACCVLHSCRIDEFGQCIADQTCGYRAVVTTAFPLEQEWGRGHPDTFVPVVKRHKGYSSVRAAYSGHDCRQHVGEVRADHK